MVETHWDDLRDRELRYQGHRWQLTGDIEVGNSGSVLGVAARQADGVRGERATLYFDIENPSKSINPGNMAQHFDRLERTADGQHLIVKTDGRTYRYVLERLSYA